MGNKKISMSIINPHVAGIDVGSRSHFVAVGQNYDEVKEFGVYAENLKSLAEYLKSKKVKTVAMESTGTLPRVDIDTWKYLGGSYSKDKNNVYCMEQIQEGESPDDWNKEKVIEHYKK